MTGAHGRRPGTQQGPFTKTIDGWVTLTEGVRAWKV